MNDSLPAELEQLLSLRNVDWTGNLIGRTEYMFHPVPIIAKNSSVYKRALEWIAILEKALIPAKRQHILMALTYLRVHFPTEAMSERESEFLVSSYISDLEKFPLDLIIHACNEYRYDSANKYFPKIAQLIAMIRPSLYMKKSKLERLKKLAEASESQRY